MVANEVDLDRLHRRSLRSFPQFLRWFYHRQHKGAGRWNLLKSAAESCRGGEGWLTDGSMLFKVKPQDRPRVIALGDEIGQATLLGDSVIRTQFPRYGNEVASYGTQPTHVVLDEDGSGRLLGVFDGPLGVMRIDMDYAGFLPRYFPGCTWLAGKKKGWGGRDCWGPVVIEWNDERVGLVMPMID